MGRDVTDSLVVLGFLCLGGAAILVALATLADRC